MAKSLNRYRFKSNPLERRFVDMWELQSETSDTLGYILSGEANKLIPVSERDAEVAVTIIQWLGSPIGQAFLETTLCIDNLRKQIPEVFKN